MPSYTFITEEQSWKNVFFFFQSICSKFAMKWNTDQITSVDFDSWFIYAKNVSTPQWFCSTPPFSHMYRSNSA